MMGAADRVFDGSVFDHQADGVIEIGVARFATLEGAPPKFTFGIAAAAESEHDRKRDLAFAKIVADVFAKPRGDATIVEGIVDELKGDAKIHPVGAACRLLGFLPSGYCRADFAGRGE